MKNVWLLWAFQPKFSPHAVRSVAIQNDEHWESDPIDSKYTQTHTLKVLSFTQHRVVCKCKKRKCIFICTKWNNNGANKFKETLFRTMTSSMAFVVVVVLSLSFDCFFLPFSFSVAALVLLLLLLKAIISIVLLKKSDNISSSFIFKLNVKRSYTTASWSFDPSSVILKHEQDEQQQEEENTCNPKIDFVVSSIQMYT